MNVSEILPNLFMGGELLPVLASGYGAVVDLRLLEDIGLCVTPDYFQQQGPALLWMPLVDDDVEPPRWKIAAAAKFVNEAIAAGQSCLVHCSEGRNRSGLITAAYMILFAGFSAADAIATIRAKRAPLLAAGKIALSNQTFCNMLENLGAT